MASIKPPLGLAIRPWTFKRTHFLHAQRFRACLHFPVINPSILAEIASLDALTVRLREEQKALVFAMSKEGALHGQVGPDLVKALTTLKD